MPKQRDSKKRKKLEAVAEKNVVAVTEADAVASSTPAAPALRLHPEVVEFLAELIVVEVNADAEVRP